MQYFWGNTAGARDGCNTSGARDGCNTSGGIQLVPGMGAILAALQL